MAKLMMDHQFVVDSSSLNSASTSSSSSSISTSPHSPHNLAQHQPSILKGKGNNISSASSGKTSSTMAERELDIDEEIGEPDEDENEEEGNMVEENGDGGGGGGKKFAKPRYSYNA
jgi:hypothetical protein